MFFVSPELAGRVEDVHTVPDLLAKKREMGFPLWGGEKTWLAPQERWTEAVPFLDLDSGPYELSIDAEGPELARARMTSRVCRETRIRITRTVELSAAAPGWTVEHRLENASRKTAEWESWSVAMVCKPGRVYLPRRPDSAFPDGIKTYANEGESVKVRASVVSFLEGLAVVACQGSRHFKFGSDSLEGWILGIVETPSGLTGYRKYVPTFPERTYAHASVIEVYNSPAHPYFEMEIHGPLATLSPGESFTLREQQAFFDVAEWPRGEGEVRALL